MVEQRFASVPAYIASFPPATQKALKAVRRAIRAAVPDADESIRYHMPTYTMPGWVLHFSGYKAHVSLHGAVERARPALKEAMARYEATGRGTLKLPLDEPMPVDLIAAVARESLKATASAAPGRGDAHRSTRSPRSKTARR